MDELPFHHDEEYKIRAAIEAPRGKLSSYTGVKFKVNNCEVKLGGFSPSVGIVLGRIVLKCNVGNRSLVYLDVKRDYVYFAESVEAYIEKVHRVLTIMSSDPHHDENGETFDMMMTARPVKGAHRC
jgi:hypothetical protein